MKNVAKKKRTKAAPTPEGPSMPIGQLVGLLTASTVTLVGVVRGIDPDAILLRAVVAACVMGVTVSVVCRTVTSLAAR